MSPDLQGEFVDIWALGVLLYFLVCGYTPFRGDTVTELKKLILTDSYEFPEHTSEQLRDLVRGLLRPVASERLTLHEIKASNEAKMRRVVF